tara:strand:+ start:52 stop:315 length:264 start_codon:yes stop_codon:yes gene_type:complete
MAKVKNAQVTANSWTISFWMEKDQKVYKVKAIVDSKIQDISVTKEIPDNNLLESEIVSDAYGNASKILGQMDFEVLGSPSFFKVKNN